MSISPARAALGLALAPVIAAGSLVMFSPVASAATNSLSDCNESYKRYYSSRSIAEVDVTVGEFVNRTSRDQKKTYTNTISGTVSATVSASIAIKKDLAVAEMNAQLGLSLSVSASVTHSSTFEVVAPRKTTVRYRDGLRLRTVYIRQVHTYTNCGKRTTYGTATGVEAFTSMRTVKHW